MDELPVRVGRQGKKLKQAVRRHLEDQHARQPQAPGKQPDPSSPLGAVLGRLADFAQPEADAEQEVELVYIWPECADVWHHWQALQTQWRVGAAGATGLDYAGVRAYLDECDVRPGPDRSELFALLRECEDEALSTWARIADQQAAARGVA